MFKRTTKYPQFEAPFSKTQRRARLLYSTAKYNGLIDTAGLLARKLLSKAGIMPSGTRKLGEGRDEIAGFDGRGIIEVDKLDVDSGKDANRYEGTPDLEFRDVLDGLRLDHSKFNFVDFGSGKAAVVAVAARYPFRSVAGVEFSQSLHDIAETNLAKLRDTDRIRAQNITLHCQDATTYSPDARPHVFYFYNPFQAETTRAVLQNCCASVINSDQASYILLKNPVQDTVFTSNPNVEKLSEPYGGSWCVYRINAK